MRIWLYQQMVNAGLVGGRIHQSTSLKAAPHTKPFIMYRQTSDIELFRGDDGDACRQLGFMIFVHDLPGDYLVIDGVMAQLRTLFSDTRDPASGVVRCRWSEVSDDLRDEDMGTIMRYARVRVIYRVGEDVDVIPEPGFTFVLDDGNFVTMSSDDAVIVDGFVGVSSDEVEIIDGFVTATLEDP